MPADNLYPCDQYFSPSTRETLTIWRDADTGEESPAPESQQVWVSAHPDTVRLRCAWFGWCPRCFRPTAPDNHEARFCPVCGARLLPAAEEATLPKAGITYERIAQKLYDLRDAVPAKDQATWNALNRIATRLSKLAGKLLARHHK